MRVRSKGLYKLCEEGRFDGRMKSQKDKAFISKQTEAIVNELEELKSDISDTLNELEVMNVRFEHDISEIMVEMLNVLDSYSEDLTGF